MAQDKTKHSDFERGWKAALKAVREAIDLNATGAFDRKDLLDMLHVLRKYK